MSPVLASNCSLARTPQTSIRAHSTSPKKPRARIKSGCPPSTSSPEPTTCSSWYSTSQKCWKPMRARRASSSPLSKATTQTTWPLLVKIMTTATSARTLAWGDLTQSKRSSLTSTRALRCQSIWRAKTGSRSPCQVTLLQSMWPWLKLLLRKGPRGRLVLRRHASQRVPARPSRPSSQLVVTKEWATRGSLSKSTRTETRLDLDHSSSTIEKSRKMPRVKYKVPSLATYFSLKSWRRRRTWSHVSKLTKQARS